MQLTRFSTGKIIHQVVRSMLNDLKAGYLQISPSVAATAPISKPVQPARLQTFKNFVGQTANQSGQPIVAPKPNPGQNMISFQVRGPLLGLLSIMNKMAKGEPIGPGHYDPTKTDGKADQL